MRSRSKGLRDGPAASVAGPFAVQGGSGVVCGRGRHPSALAFRIRVGERPAA